MKNIELDWGFNIRNNLRIISYFMMKTLKTFHVFLLKYKRLFVIFLMTTVAGAVLENLGPYFYKLLIDGVSGGDFKNLTTILLIYGGTRLIANGLNALSGFLGDRSAARAARDLRISAFRRIQELDFAYHVNKNTGSLISAFKRGDGAYFNLYFNMYREILPTLVSISVIFFFFSGLNWKFVWIMAGLLLLNSLLAYVFIKRNLKNRREFNDEEDKISAIITDNLINYETVKFFAQEEKEEKRLKEGFVSWLNKFFAYVNTFKAIDTIIGSVSFITMTLMLGLMIDDLSKGRLTVGDFTMVSSFMMGFYYQFFGLIWQIRGIAKNFTDIEKYFAILDEEILVKDVDGAKKIEEIEGNIEFNKVDFNYPGIAKKAIKEVSLKIGAGRSVALVGKSGAGKTTLVKLLLRFYDLNSGSIKIDGIDISQMTKSNLRSFMGVVPQEPVLFNNTIAFNIGYGVERASKKLIRKAARMANLADFIESLPKGYDTEVGERGVKLSGGQKQRLAIARALLIKPKILIFDEATSNLDSESEEKVQSALWKTAKDRTTLIVAHRFSTIRRADVIVVLDKGRIVEVGTHQELIKMAGLYFKLWSLQFMKAEKDGIEIGGGGLFKED